MTRRRYRRSITSLLAKDARKLEVTRCAFKQAIEQAWPPMHQSSFQDNSMPERSAAGIQPCD